MIGVYKITNPNGRIYIGSSINIENRWYQYKVLNCKFQRKLYNSLKKHGVKAHKFEILEICDVKNLYKRENDYGVQFDVLNSSNLNCKLPKAEDTYQHMSEETKKKISDANKIALNTLENKLRCGLINKGKSLSDEIKKKISMSVKKISYEHKFTKIIQYDLNDNFIKIWESLKKASEYLNIHANAISNVLTGRAKTSGGYKWKYYNN